MGGKRTKSRYPKWADLDTDEILSQYPLQYIKCRRNHLWDQHLIYKLIGPEVWEVQQGCRCGALKKWIVAGKEKREVREPYTYYPPGYLAPGTGLTRTDWKTGQIVRDFDEALKEGRVFQTEPKDEETTEPRGNAA